LQFKYYNILGYNYSILLYLRSIFRVITVQFPIILRCICKKAFIYKRANPIPLILISSLVLTLNPSLSYIGLNLYS
jgi:hypothetical protein